MSKICLIKWDDAQKQVINYENRVKNMSTYFLPSLFAVNVRQHRRLW